jgi:ribose-phosphate pyrophosphokinase
MFSRFASQSKTFYQSWTASARTFHNHATNHTKFKLCNKRTAAFTAITAVSLCGISSAVLLNHNNANNVLHSDDNLPTHITTHPASLAVDKQSFEDFAIFSGRANPELANEIARCLGVPLGQIKIQGYADGEIGIQVNENVRGKDVYIIQPTSPPGVNDHLIELLLMVSTMRRASARKITAIIPYYGYARQDRKMASRVPISAADVARLLQAMGVDRVVAVDLHCGQIQGFFGPRTPCDNLEAHVVALPYFQELGLSGETTKVVSPDAGGVYRAKRFRDGLKTLGIDAGLAMIVKQRIRANEVGRMDLVGDVKDCDVIMVDDMIDTAGTLTQAANELKAMGAKRIFAFATHGLFSGPAYERIHKSDLEKVIVTNTIPLPDGVQRQKIVQISVAELLSAAIARIHLKKSVSELFSKEHQKE